MREKLTMPSHVLSAIGVFGMALTLFGNMQSFFVFADWVHYFVETWRALTHAFWQALLSWLPVKISQSISSALTYASILTALGVGARANGSSTDVFWNEASEWDGNWQSSWVGQHLPACFTAAACILCCAVVAGYISDTVSATQLDFLFLGFCVCIGLREFSNEPKKFLVITMAALGAFPIYVIAIRGMGKVDTSSVEFAIVLAIMIASKLAFGYAHPKDLLSRLAQVYVVVGLLLITNEIAKLGIKIDAPPKV
jgi:hypothetical protein